MRRFRNTEKMLEYSEQVNGLKVEYKKTLINHQKFKCNFLVNCFRHEFGKRMYPATDWHYREIRWEINKCLKYEDLKLNKMISEQRINRDH